MMKFKDFMRTVNELIDEFDEVEPASVNIFSIIVDKNFYSKHKSNLNLYKIKIIPYNQKEDEEWNEYYTEPLKFNQLEICYVDDKYRGSMYIFVLTEQEEMIKNVLE